MISHPMNERLRNASFLLENIIRSPLSVFTTLVVSVGFVLFALWFPMRNFLWFMFTKSNFETSAKLRILISSLQGIETNYTMFTRVLLILSAIFTGLVVGALLLYLRRRVGLERSTGTSVLGIVVSVIGIGCASCGSIILTSLFGIGALSFTAILPLNGVEFSILGILLLLYSFFSIANKYSNPLACKTKKQKKDRNKMNHNHI